MHDTLSTMRPACAFRSLACIIGLVAVAPAVYAQVELRPVDEAARQADFFTFRAHLQAAIARRDVQTVLANVHKDVKNSFGGNDGIVEFQKLWRIGQPDSPLWKEMGTVLALGGTFDAAGRFVAPYIFSRWPEAVDAFEHVAIVGTNVRVRAAPRTDSATLTSLTFGIVALAPDAKPLSAESGWTAIRLRDGRTGYVASQFARSPIDYRAIFQRINDQWQLVTFLAGD
jgi:hypothetical protein